MVYVWYKHGLYNSLYMGSMVYTWDNPTINILNILTHRDSDCLLLSLTQNLVGWVSDAGLTRHIEIAIVE